MRYEPIEIGLAGKTTGRRHAERAPRSKTAADWKIAAEPTLPPTDAIDEAFAGLSRSDSRVRRVDTAFGSQEAKSGTGGRRPKALEVVTQLAAQLDALDRQREQLAQLLRDIEVTSLSD